MGAKKAAKRASGKAARRTSTSDTRAEAFTAEERAAMRERARELKAARSRPGSESDEGMVLAKIDELPPKDRAMARRVHELVRAAVPELAPRLWYGMPAYARDGQVVCFFQAAQKFKSRYATLGFSDKAALDDGTMWPTAFALHELTPADETRITELVKRAAH
jgi:uncharacterized protein YdhG (YjbR/CyaY superfamily)